MRSVRVRLAIGVAVLGVVVTGAAAVAGDRGKLRTSLGGYEEVPAVSTAGNGSFRATLNAARDQISYELRYADLEGGAVQQAHIHVGQKSVNGGISVWLCSNLASPPTPAGVQACPAPPAVVTGTIAAADVVGPAAQGVPAGALDELVRALRAGVAYANVHTATFAGGEIRGQLDRSKRGRRGHDN